LSAFRNGKTPFGVQGPERIDGIIDNARKMKRAFHMAEMTRRDLALSRPPSVSNFMNGMLNLAYARLYIFCCSQCCGSGSGIRCLLTPGPGSGIGIGFSPDLGSRIPTPYFLEISDKFSGKKFYSAGQEEGRESAWDSRKPSLCRGRSFKL
jgi:hypothetical protein